MALEFMDGFDHLSATDLVLKWDSTSATAFSKVTGVFGVGLALEGAATRTITRTLAAIATRIVFFHMRVTTLPGSDTAFLIFRDGATTQTDIRLTSTGALRATRNGTSLGVTSAGVINTNTWYFVAVKVTISDASGAVDIEVNTVSQLSLSGVDTKNTANATTDVVAFVMPASNTTWDNVVIRDTTGTDNNAMPTEELRIETSAPTGAGNYAQFTPSAGSNYQNVDDATSVDSDTTYNESTNPTDRDSFAMADFTATSGVEAVQVNMIARKTDGGTRELKASFRISSTDYDSAVAALASTYACHRAVFGVSPATSSAWAMTDLNSAEAGYKLET